MTRISFATFVALTLLSSTAWACDPMGGNVFLIGLIIAPFMALPYSLFGTTVIASQSKVWFKRPLKGWFLATIGAWIACTVGGVAGFGLAQLASGAGGGTQNLESTLVLSSPLVFEIAYLMWLHSRRPVETDAVV